MEDARISSLAETMRKSGLATSASDAIRMAKNIIGTEQKVSSSFNKYSQPTPSRTMSYQEEIDDLIRKTSPEFKQYHVPIRGYTTEPRAPKVEQKPAEVFYELEEPVAAKNEPAPAAHEVYTDVLSEEDQKPLSEVFSVKDAGEVMVNDSFSSVKQDEQKEEFIVPVQKEEVPQKMFTEIKEEKKNRTIQNPIEKIDLMNFFKAG